MPFTLTMPKLSPTMEEGIIAKWHKKEGEFVEVGDVILEVITDKATIEHSSLDSGYLRKILISEGGKAEVNQPIALFTETADEPLDTSPSSKPSSSTHTLPTQASQSPIPSSPAIDTETQSETSKKSPPSNRIIASPFAKKLAKERKLDLSTIQGSGPGNRIVSEDLPHPNGGVLEVKLSPMREAIMNRLQSAKGQIPHFYVSLNIRADKLVDAKEQLRAQGSAISLNDLIIRAVALSLKQHPEINTGFHPTHHTFIQYQTIDISIAVVIPDGLITPVIRNADQKNLEEISLEAKRVILKAKEGKLQPEEYTGGSFTVSNLGMYGISDFIAIVNPPQGAILAVGGIQDQPVISSDQLIVPGKVMRLTLSADHRVIDGAQAALFLKSLQQYLEHPIHLVLPIH